MKNLIKDISIYSICHFIVDFVSCIFVLGVASYYCNSNIEYYAEILLYNFFAFAFQVPLGMLMDKFKIYKYVGIIGFCLIGLCYLCPLQIPVLMASIVGIGNGLFHLEGGVNAYEYSKGKAFINGLFVAPGALGIFLGTFFYKELAFGEMPIILIALAILLLSIIQKRELNYIICNEEKGNTQQLKGKSGIIIVLLIGISIIVRSLGGSAIKYAWKNPSMLLIGLTYTLFVVLGKAFGGLIGDKFGLKRTAVIALITSCMCLLMGYIIPAFGYIRNFII